MHDLLREYAYELVQADDETARRQAVDRLVTHYLGTAETARRVVDPPRDDHIRLVPVIDRRPMEDGNEAWAWFRREHRVLVSIVDLAFREGMNEHAWQLARALTTFLDRELIGRTGGRPRRSPCTRLSVSVILRPRPRHTGRSPTWPYSRGA
jgi:hypothetical protein